MPAGFLDRHPSKRVQLHQFGSYRVLPRQASQHLVEGEQTFGFLRPRVGVLAKFHALVVASSLVTPLLRSLCFVVLQSYLLDIIFIMDSSAKFIYCKLYR